MKLKTKAIMAVLLLVLFLLSLVGCGKLSAKNPEDSLTLQSGATQMEWIENSTVVPVTPLAELETPTLLYYIHDGEITTFSPEDTAFSYILELNENRDNLDRLNDHNWGELLASAASPNDIVSNSATYGNCYLLYRYPADSYGDILFTLCTAEEGENWIYEASAECHSPVGYLASADELLAYLEKISG